VFDNVLNIITLGEGNLWREKKIFV